MIDQQTQALLSYNAANPEVIRRIVQERGLTQDQVAQALNLSPEAASRYGGISAAGEGAGQVDPNAAKPGPGDSQQMGSMSPVGAANAASQALSAGSAGGGFSAGSAGGAPAAMLMQKPMPEPMAEKPGIPPSGPMNAGIKPAAADAGMGKPPMMKPQGLADTRMQMRRPNTTALPGDEEFQRAFERIRGARA